MPNQLRNLIIVFAIFVGLFLTARHFLVPKTFGDLGHYRADALQYNIDHEKKFVDTTLCSNCHTDISNSKYVGAHKLINCQTCHGAGNKHIENPTINKMEKSSEREFCAKCHAKNLARSSTVIKQVDITKHNIDSKCVNCHNPHSPEIKMAQVASNQNKKDEPAICIMCHDKIDKIKTKGMHKSVPCQSCHGEGLNHIKSPSKSNMFKPSKREFCGKCHGIGIAPKSKGIKQIDLKEHNIENKCIDCHIGHNPLEFK